MTFDKVADRSAAAGSLGSEVRPPAKGGLRGRWRIWIGLIGYHVTAWVLCNPGPLRPLFALLRRLRPIAVTGTTVLLGKGADAREVLDRFEDFTLGEVLSPRMPWGPFLLTIDWRDQHDRERALFESMVARGDDIARLRDIAASVCETAIAEASRAYDGRRQIDVVRGVCEPVVVAVADRYFGIPVVRADVSHTAQLLREIAGIAMVSPPEGSRRDARAKAAIAELTRHVTDAIASEASRVVPAPMAPAQPGQSLLERLVRAARAPDKPVWLDDDFVRRYVTGLAATGGATIVRASTNALYELLCRPRALRLALSACATLDRAERECATLERNPDATVYARRQALVALEVARDELRQLIYEALRFRPMLPLLLRYTPRDALIAKGTPRQRLIKAGASVIAAPTAVMFDPAEFESPGEFRSQRPLTSYVHFGFGPRTCFGKYVADTVMLEIFRCLLKLPGIALSEGWGGLINYDGPVADSLIVTFAPFSSNTNVE